MTVRLVLVSLVACLGLTLPSAEKLECWARAGQAWTNGWLAEWENGGPIDEGRFVFVPDAIEAVAVPAEAVAAAPQVAPDAFQGEDEVIAALLAEWMAQDEASAIGSAPVVAATAPPEQNEDEVIAALLAELMTQEDATAIAPAPVVTATVTPAQNEETAAVVGDEEQAWWEARFWVTGFPGLIDEEEFTVLANAVEFVPKTVEAPRTESADQAFEAIVNELAVAFTKDAEALAAKAAAEKAQVASSATPETGSSLGLWEAEEDFYAALADALNREADDLGTNVASAPLAAPKMVAEPSAGPQGGRLAHAIRLTREAVSAWAGLLHGPAIVTIER